jgi:hypothetical protein
MMSGPIDNALRTSVVRFPEVLNQPLEADIPGPTLIGENYSVCKTDAPASGASVDGSSGNDGGSRLCRVRLCVIAPGCVP